MFVLFAGALATATHWPGLAIDGPIDRTDLVLHVAAFAVWTSLLIGSGLFGPATAARNICAAGAVALVYAPLDELTQALPFVDRHVSAADLAANVGGVALGVGLASLVAARTRAGAAAALPVGGD